MIFCENCNGITFVIFEYGTILCTNCDRIYNVIYKEEDKSVYIEDTGLVK